MGLVLSLQTEVFDISVIFAIHVYWHLALTSPHDHKMLAKGSGHDVFTSVSQV